jgi:metal-responsive CopG/Arc/MetJ family transcriptional regulator
VGTKKVAISMPEPMFREMERARKRKTSDRSTWIQEAIGERLTREHQDVAAAAYVRGYQLHPEKPEEVARAEASARALFEALDAEDGGWPDASR